MEKSTWDKMYVLNKKGAVGRRFANFYVNSVYKLFDGMVIMTYPLLDYFEGKTKSACKKIVVPMTVEAERFENVKKIDQDPYIGYCGYIGGNKDGVENLIRSFGIVSKKYPRLKLLLIGPAKEKDFQKLEEIVMNEDIKNVIFNGPVSRDEMPSLLVNAKILALARPSSLQSTGGFPTKLGEYLSTGNPTIVTAVGDIPRYLTHKKDIYMVKPDDIELFAVTITEMLDNYDEAKMIAKEGKRHVHETFSYKVQSEKMHEFFIELIS